MKQTEEKVEDQLVYDYQFAGGSVLSIGEDILTSSDTYMWEEEGIERLCAKIKVNTGKRTRYYLADEIELSRGRKVSVVKLTEPGPEGEKGQIFLQEIKA